MGSTLSRAAEWTSARGGSSGKLTSSPINNDILEEAVYFLKNYQTMNPGAQNLVFKSALKWKTSLLPQDMKGFTTAEVRQSPGAVEHEIEVLEKVLPTGKPDSILDYIRPTGVTASTETYEAFIHRVGQKLGQKLTYVSDNGSTRLNVVTHDVPIKGKFRNRHLRFYCIRPEWSDICWQKWQQ
ncbi:hypothetical protein CLF_103109 [Clonorchis sinensis]|uniref:Uncharacterized protein n=1 Tax=Clonorchis sinensis TaxID=79923 RepID=G7Y939_CLOSI|nr:hypothetical protein CLF_103109 [Clonorchis sinensis]